MPVLVWEMTDQGPKSSVETDRAKLFTPEEWRHEAEVLDAELDAVLDRAVDEALRRSDQGAPPEFARAWSIGRALRDSAVLDLPALVNEPRHHLWQALAKKCRTGVRSDRTIDARWSDLRPSTAREPRREGKRLDHFEMCIWLAEQDFNDAVQTFGGSIRNVWQMLERPTLRPPIVRRAFLSWLATLDLHVREAALQPRTFPELMKALRARWPDRGPGSAKRPIHYTEEQFAGEITQVLNAVLEEAT